MTNPTFGRLVSVGMLLTAGTSLLLTGCVRRRMTIRTSPPGATVYMDNYEIGPTPRSVNFTHYGTRQIRLVKDGFETLTVQQRVPAPWYQVPPLDFISENLVPGEIRDHRTFDYRLTPQAVVPPDQLLSRAEALRSRAGRTGIFRTPLGSPSLPAATPGPTPPPARGLVPSRGGSGPPGWPAPNSNFSPPPSSRLQPIPPPAAGPSLHTLPPGGRPLR